MRKKWLYLIMPIITLILEILPYGAVCNFATPDKIIRETYSYFSLTPFGYAYFPPLLTAITTCVLLIFLTAYLFIDKPVLRKTIKVLLCVGIGLSLCPLLYGFNYYSLVGALITVSLIAQLILFATNKI